MIRDWRVWAAEFDATIAERLLMLDEDLEFLDNVYTIEAAFRGKRSAKRSLLYALAHCRNGDPRRAARELAVLEHRVSELVAPQHGSGGRQILPDHYKR